MRTHKAALHAAVIAKDTQLAAVVAAKEREREAMAAAKEQELEALRGHVARVMAELTVTLLP